MPSFKRQRYGESKEEKMDIEPFSFNKPSRPTLRYSPVSYKPQAYRFGQRPFYKQNIRSGGYLGIERKFYDTNLNAANLTAPTDASGMEHNPSATICLNSVVQGDGESNRDGRRITMKSIQVKGTVFWGNLINQTVVPPACSVFIALIQDMQTNGALLNSEDVFVNKGGTALGNNALTRDLQYSTRFKVLKTWIIQCDTPPVSWDGTNIEVGGGSAQFQGFIKLPDVITNYTSTTESIANIVDNSLSICACTTSTGLSPALSYNARLRFVG